jgi:hypothetical protein
MKRLLTLTLSVLLAATAFGQDQTATPKDSLTYSVELDNLRKIAFKDDSVVTTYSDGSTKTQKLSENEKLQFSLPDKTDKSIADDEVTYTIYDLSGRPVKTHTDKNSDQPFDLNDLSSGIYLLKTGNRTIKIVK